MSSCIIFTQALRAGSSNSGLDGSLDGDVSFTNFMNNVVMNITYCRAGANGPAGQVLA